MKRRHWTPAKQSGWGFFFVGFFCCCCSTEPQLFLLRATRPGIIFAHTAHSASRSQSWYHRHFKQPEGSRGRSPSIGGSNDPLVGILPGATQMRLISSGKFCGRPYWRFVRIKLPPNTPPPKAEEKGRSFAITFVFSFIRGVVWAGLRNHPALE